MHVQKRYLLPIAALGLAASASAFAQTPEWRMPWSDNFWGYFGASAGESKFRGNCSSLFDCDQKDSAWRVHGGGNFNNLVGLEVGYTDFGRMRSFGGDTDARAANVSLTAGLPL